MKQFMLYSILGLLFLSGCAGKEDSIPKRDCPIEELLLDKSDYPPDTILNDIISPIADKPLESADRSANYLNNATFQEVVRYSSRDNSVAQYNKVQQFVFDPDDVFGSWETPPILDLDNLSADRHEIACGNVISFGKHCYMIGQYEEYYIFFRADISSNGISYELYRDLVLRIDNEMASCLGR